MYKSSQGGARIDLLLTDPPYNVNYEGTAGKIKNDNMEDGAFRRFLTDAFTNATAVMKPGAPFYIWHADSEGYNFRGACRDSALQVRQCLIWVKNSIVLGRQDFQWKHEPCLYGEKEIEEDETEPCLYGWKAGAKHYFFKNRRQSTVLEFPKPRKSKEHPTMKPIRLFDYQMQCSTKPGDRVMDLFAGSGTTIMACEQNGRKAYCMEFDPKFADVIIARWEEFTGKKAVLLDD
jgi:site-specific DNA-methyltransferase (adenine-specific)